MSLGIAWAVIVKSDSRVEIRQPHLTTLELVVPNRAPWGMGRRDTASVGDDRPKDV